MKKFNELAEEMEVAKVEGDKFYVNDNMQAGKRFFASLMSVERKCKAAREELSEARRDLREERQHGGG